jgi:hypothetical protein
MTGGRLRLDRATVVDPVGNALPQAEAEGSGRHGGGGSSRPSPAVLLPSNGLGVASNHSDSKPSRKTSKRGAHSNRTGCVALAA